MTVPEMRSWRKKLRGVVLLSAARGSGGKSKPISRNSSKNIERASSNQEERETKGEEEKEKKLGEASSIDTTTTTKEWVITIKEKLNHVLPCERVGSWLDHCIFRVPRNLREIDPKAYAPQILSIGPYHRGKSRLAEMEKHKWRFLRHLLERTGHSVELYLESMSELEEQARQCYAGPIIDMGSREFVEMMILDASFIVELLRGSIEGFIYCGYSWGDPIFTARGVLPFLQRDMLMLENQLPFFVLNRFFELTSELDKTSSSMIQLALQFFNLAIPGCYNPKKRENSERQALHLLDVIRESLLPSQGTTFECCPAKVHHPQLMPHCVVGLRSCGIKFRKRKSDKFMEIKFHKGVLEIPPLVIHDSTKSIFLNLMAFEQCYPHCSNHVTSYISFMDGLINCPQDVGHLRRQGIIDHGLGSEAEVARLFNGLCREIAFDVNDCYLSGVSAGVNLYFDRRWHAWRASLMNEYLRHPWAIVSLLAATLLIGVTLIQTFYSVFAYYVPNS
ncbi:UPF0481 protein At3g47200-like [Tasmannia lanceolata]|uniref:UPF0481 protein At3g47200-like n=1 Tax=Tasmannia lanceolata TaxID=3420 RepID=UPI004064BC22